MSSQKKYINLESWLIGAKSSTKTTNPNAPDLIARKILKLNSSELISKSKYIYLSRKNLLKLNNLLGKVLAGRPLSAVLKNTEFHNIKLKINPRVLSPRAETEELVEYAIKNIPKNSKVFDIGTGSGAIGLSVAKARPDLNITITDLSNKTLNLAKLNARKNKINSVRFIKSSLFKDIDQKDIKGTYILANLPYVNPNWRGLKHKNLKYEPHSALFAGDNGLQIIKNLLNQITSKKALTKNNWVLLEHDPKQLKTLTDYCSRLNMSTQSISPFVSLVKLK